ncbi:MaoC family dehydratase N-terminal domain-containing protein [Nocardioides sp. YIM 152588]|uniref:FAS1-like dehydratase domain-containing protein n=1 Tax=Nocardioides sp. YIM 152588 TaxID=3158259 RepID=UPI0032E4BE50
MSDTTLSDAPPTTHVSAAMADAVGTEIGRSVSHPVTDSDIRRWAIAVYWPDPPPSRFLEPAADGGPLVAPEEINPFAWSVASRSEDPLEGTTGHDPDRTEKQVGIEGPGLTNMLNGGLTVEYGVPIRAGDVITSVRRLGPYSEREGRLGLMLFSRTEDTWTNADGEVVRHTVNTLIRY